MANGLTSIENGFNGGTASTSSNRLRRLELTRQANSF
jgi:hypothetical protein